MMRASEVAGDDAGSNHHFRAAKHRVLDMLWGQYKIRITLGGRVGRHRVEWWLEGAFNGGAAADRHSTMMRASDVVLAGGDADSNNHSATKHRTTTSEPLIIASFDMSS